MNNHVLISGKPRVGKTTLIKQLIAILQRNYSIAGFYTEEVQERGKRVGFDIYTIGGKIGVLARSTSPPCEYYYRLGKYMVATKDLESLAIPELHKKVDIIICDEIGKMELFSIKFKEAIMYALNEQSFVLATISIHNIPFIKKVKLREDTIVLELTMNNREAFQETVIDEVKKGITKNN
jgi:nucleoside-triphosphatase